MRLSARVAIVTGAQQGIGEAIALAYGREGARVVVNYLDDAAAAEAIAGRIAAAGGRARTDRTKTAQWWSGWAFSKASCCSAVASFWYLAFHSG